jgi:hypothetical protein
LGPVNGGLGWRGVAGLGANARLPRPPLAFVKGSPVTGLLEVGIGLEMVTVDSCWRSGAVGDLL